MKRIFLTGITGLVGSAFAVKLLQERNDCELVCLVRSGNGKSAAERTIDVIKSECEFEGCKFTPKGMLQIQINQKVDLPICLRYRKSVRVVLGELNMYNVAIIGAGPAGIFSALEIVRLRPEWKVILIEKGQKIEKRKCPIREGSPKCVRGIWVDKCIISSLIGNNLYLLSA